MNKTYLFLLIVSLIFEMDIKAQNIKRDSIFDFNWKFYRGAYLGAEKPEINDNAWRKIDIPHDWSIEDLPEKYKSDSLSIKKPSTKPRVISGPFDSESIGGKNTGFTVGGTGWYRKHFKVPENWQNKIVSIVFDGVYMNADVWINGHHLGNHPYGYTAFWYILSPHLNFHNQDNVLAVEVKNEGINSRWYSGSGIYRHVWLNVTNKISIAQWGNFISTPEVSNENAKVHIRSTLNNSTGAKTDIKFIVSIKNANDQIITEKEISTRIHESVPSVINMSLDIPQPELWSPDNPNLYKAVYAIKINDSLIDKTETQFGIRSIRFDPEKGFFLNGQNIKLKGGAVHSNNGPLGAAAYDRAEERRVELMKVAGFNAVRCAHNPPSSSFLDACDRIGMLVIDEAFDVWDLGWLQDDYHVFYKDWWQQDISSMLLRDRNHPSIFTWSIGNQIRNGRDSIAVSEAHQIADLVRKLDPSRPVTANIAMFISGNWLNGSPVYWKDFDPIFEALDICGYSYQSSQYENVHERLPDRIQFSSEVNPKACFENWMRTIDHDFVIGNFTWTAMDFFGDASAGWLGFNPSIIFPWYSTYCGDIDLCGFRKPRSFYRDILFGHGEKLYTFVYTPVPSFEGENVSLWGWDDVKSSWTWPGHEGKNLKIEAYSACDSVQLYLNGNYLGSKPTSRETQFKAFWMVPYEKGELVALGFSNNKEFRYSLKTAGNPSKIRLVPDKKKIVANGQDLCFITVEITDDNGFLVPYANNLVSFKIEGPGSIEAVGSSDPTSLESFKLPMRKAYEGKCLVIVRSGNQSGEITLNAFSKGLTPDHLTITTENQAHSTLK